MRQSAEKVEKFFQDKFWNPIKDFLNCYTDKISPSSFIGAEPWVLLRLIILIITLIYCGQAYNKEYLFSFPAILISLLCIVDILIVNTKLVFISRQPKDVIRSIKLTFITFIQICICWAIFYYSFGQSFSPNLDRINAVYFSFVTITTLGYGDIYPLKGDIISKFFIISELIIGFYFLAVIVAIVVSWANNSNSNKDSIQSKAKSKEK